MSNKRVTDLTNPNERAIAQQWAKALVINDLTTRKWDYAAQLSANRLSNHEIRATIIQKRRRKQRKELTYANIEKTHVDIRYNRHSIGSIRRS